MAKLHCVIRLFNQPEQYSRSRFLFLVGVAVLALLTALPITASADSRGLERYKEKSSEVIRTPFTKGNYRALVIGNNSYQDVQGIWKPLRTAIKDAESVARILSNDYGFSDLVLLRNATRRQILLAINDMRNRVGDGDSVLIYYAGHGYMDNNTSEAYWVPVDAEGWDDSFFLSNARIKEKLATVATKAKHTLIVSDSCFSGTLLRGAGTIRAPKIQDEPYFKKVALRRSVHIMAAGGAEFVDDDFRNSGHSPYTYFFLNELKQNDKELVTSTDLANSLSKRVANNVRQTPQYGVLFGAGDEGGEFVFRKAVEPPVAVAKSVDPKQGTQVLALNTTAKAAAATDRAMIEMSFWNSIKDMEDPQLFVDYLDKYPDGTFSQIAQRKLQILGGPKSEIDLIGQVVLSYKQSFEARDPVAIRQISELQPVSDRFLAGFLQQYRSFDVRVSGLRHIKREHKAKLTISLVNLVNKSGRPVVPGPWGRFEVEVRKNDYGNWKVYW